MLWEDQFYESGESIADRIVSLAKQVKPEIVQSIAFDARARMKLRHVPLLLLSTLAENGGLTWQVVESVIQRADELAELVAIYWKNGKKPLKQSLKKGLAAAFLKFNEYALAKYDRTGKIRLRDVLFLCHAKPATDEQAAIWKRLVANELVVPDTWEVALSYAGKDGDKNGIWQRLLSEQKLGALAMLRNLRNMIQAGVDESLIRHSLETMKTDRVLPFRFIAAAKHAPRLEDAIEQAMFKCVNGVEKLPGKTILMVDTSGSMHSGQVSAKSDLTRVDAATALAILIREVCQTARIYATAGNDSTRIHATAEVPARRGFGLSDAIWGEHMRKAIGGGGIFLKQMLDWIFDLEKVAERIIVITDEQDCDVKLSPASANAFGRFNYIVNVASYKVGIAYDKFTHINGWSESIIDFVREHERIEQLQQ